MLKNQEHIVPSWFFDRVMYLSLSAVRVLCAVLHHGQQICNSDGHPVVYLHLSLSDFEKRSNLTRKSLLRGIAEARSLGLLVHFRALSPDKPAGYAVPLHHGESIPVTSSTHGVSIPPQAFSHGESIPLEENESIKEKEDCVDAVVDITQQQQLTGVKRESEGEQGIGESIPPHLPEMLSSIGELFPQALIEHYGAVQVSRALEIVEAASRKGRIKNKPGFLRSLLKSGPLPEKVGARHAVPLSFGKFDHIVRR